MNEQEAIRQLTKNNEYTQAYLDRETQREYPDRKLIAELASAIARKAEQIAALLNAPGS